MSALIAAPEASAGQTALFADGRIGFTTAEAPLGHDANATPITGVGSGIRFAFVSGFAGSFTALTH